MNFQPDPWAIEASRLPLAFAQVREDPRLDVALAAGLAPGSTVVMIASGGETAVCLGRLPLKLHLVDMNPAQLALSRLKWHLAGKGDPTEAMELLGYLPSDAGTRGLKLSESLSEIGLGADALGPLEIIARLGPDQAGRYETTIAELRNELAPWRAELDEILNSAEPVLDLDETPMGKAMDAAFAKVMSLDNLVQLFGQEATQNPRRSFSDHFAWRTREAFARHAPRENPFLWQILAGKFHADYPYDWLLPMAAVDARKLTEDVEWHRGKMAEIQDNLPAGSAGMVHLSNILDWLSPAEARDTLHKTARVLEPGGKVIIRQLNSTLDIPELDSGFTWDLGLGEAMELRDRSYFYPGIFIGTRV